MLALVTVGSVRPVGGAADADGAAAAVALVAAAGVASFREQATAPARTSPASAAPCPNRVTEPG